MDSATTVQEAYQLIKDHRVTFYFVTHMRNFPDLKTDTESGEFVKHALGIKVNEGARIETGMLQDPSKEAIDKKCKESIAEKDGWWTFDLARGKLAYPAFRFRLGERYHSMHPYLAVRSSRYNWLRARFTADKDLTNREELKIENLHVQELIRLLKRIGR